MKNKLLYFILSYFLIPFSYAQNYSTDEIINDREKAIVLANKLDGEKRCYASPNKVEGYASFQSNNFQFEKDGFLKD